MNKKYSVEFNFKMVFDAENEYEAKKIFIKTIENHNYDSDKILKFAQVKEWNPKYEISKS